MSEIDRKLPDSANEEGFVLVVALAILLVLSMISIAGIDNTSIELQIAGNERGAAVNFYQAEGAAQEGFRKVLDEDDTETLLPALSIPIPDDALIRPADEDEEVETVDISNLDTNGDDKIDTTDNFAVSDIDGDVDATVRHVATLNAIPTGSSLTLGSTRLYDYSVYGVSEDNRNGKKIVKIGLKKRF